MGRSTESVSVNVTAPTKSMGFHYIVAAGMYAGGCAELLSASWKAGGVWDDGNDIGAWSNSQVQRAAARGYACADWLKDDTMRRAFVGVGAVKVNVCPQEPYDATMVISGGSINGTVLWGNYPSVEVGSGVQLSGTIKVTVKRTIPCASCIYPLGMTPSWGDPKTSYRCPVANLPDGTSTHTVTLSSLKGPTQTGDHFIIFMASLETGCEYILSATHWPTGQPHWGDGNDLAHASGVQIADAARKGYMCTSWRKTSGDFELVWAAAAAVRIRVR
jgi:hypothetical protein